MKLLLPRGPSQRGNRPGRAWPGPQVGVALGALILGAFSIPGVYPSRNDAGALNSEDLSRSLAASPLTQEQKVFHVLSRLAFGPRPGDLEKVKTIGVAAYISQQLNPVSIDDSALEERLKPLETIRLSSRELAERFAGPGQAQKRRLAGERDHMRRGFQGDAPDADQKEMEAAGRKAMEGVRRVATELAQAKVLRAVYSERQLQEVMADFWFNHFNVFIGKGADRVLTTDYEREVIRPNALGNFHELLLATAKSPAMLFYLDNWMSVDPNARPPDRSVRSPSRRMPAAFGRDMQERPLARTKQPRGLNENYARELMELHTLGVEGGYTQKDVIAVARCFTGWTLRNPRQGGGFQFAEFLHDNAEKIVLGKKIPAGGGVKDGEMVLKMLSKHPSTAHFISSKLCRRFVSDNPPESLVRRCADTFLKTDGDIRRILATIFTSPEFYSKEAYRAKTKKPLELVASALRATGAQMTVPPPRILISLRTMGEMLYGCQPPTGYADTADAWINAGALLERVNFANALASGRLPGVRIGVDDPEYSKARMSDFVPKLAQAILCDIPRTELVSAVQRQLEKSEQEEALGNKRRVTLVAGVILGSPEFQQR